MKRIFKILLALIIGFFLYIIYLLYFHEGESMAIEISKEIERFKIEKGHYPYCNDSRCLIDSLGLNGNEFYPEYFSYHLDRGKEYYLLKIYDDKKVKDIYDSRTEKVVKLK